MSFTMALSAGVPAKLTKEEKNDALRDDLQTA